MFGHKGVAYWLWQVSFSLYGRVGGGLCGELYHEQYEVQGDEGVDHISGTRASIYIPFFVVITGFNDVSGRVGGGLCGELCHEQDEVQGEEGVDHISRMTFKTGMDMKTKYDP